MTGNNKEQSPVAIDICDVVQDSSLIDLEMSEVWSTATNGTFVNNGHSVSFTPVDSATTTNHIGTYKLVSFHMHWGERYNRRGSEHTVRKDKKIILPKPALEIQFVHSLINTTESERDLLSMIAVLADEDEDAPLTAPWTQLDPTAVKAYNSEITIQDFLIDQLLPDDLSYWFYEGSLTTPPCTESVAWFVLRNRITVPSAYLEKLREVEDSSGTAITYNWRDTQRLGSRDIYVQFY